MIIKEIYVEAKKSKNYQTYTIGITAKVNEAEELTYDETMDVKRLQSKARKMCNEQLEIDKQ